MNLKCYLFTFIFLILNQSPIFPETIKIGSILPLTGKNSPIGERSKIIQTVAQDYINSELSSTQKKIEIIFEDGAGDPKRSVEAIRRLIHKKVNFILCNLASVCMAVQPLAEKFGVILIGYTSYPEFPGTDSKYSFCHGNKPFQEAVTIGEFLVSNLKSERIAMLYVATDYGDSFATALNRYLEKKGLTVNLEGRHGLEKAEDIFPGDWLKSLMALNIDTIVIASGGVYPKIILKTIRRIGYKGRIITSLDTLNVVSLTGYTIDDAKGVYQVVFDFNQAEKRYVSLEKKPSVTNIGGFSEYGLMEFNSIVLLADAITKVGDDPTKVAEYIKKHEKFNGVGEKMSITKEGEIFPPIKVVKR